MKKLIIFITIISIIALTFVGCSSEIDVDKTVKKLEKRGLTVTQSVTSADELKEMSAIFNSEVAYMGGDFTVEVTKYVALIEGDDYYNQCQIVTFATEKEAMSYAELEIDFNKSTYGDNSEWKVAQSGCVVVITNLDVVFKTVKADFK